MSKFSWIGLVAALLMAGAARSAPQTDALIAQTQAALDAGDALGAANLADSGLNGEALSSGQRGRLFLYRGLAVELLGFDDRAMSDFTAALGSDALLPAERAQALLQRGFLLDGLGRLEEAVRDYTAAIALKGDSLATALNNRANIYRRQRKFADARRDYHAALSASGGKPQYSWYGLGQIAEAEADTVAARGFYAKAVAADPAYTLASERLRALGGPPENSIASAQDRIVLHPPAPASTAASAQQTTKDANSAQALHKPQSLAAVPSSWHAARDQNRKEPGQESGQDPGKASSRQTSGNKPALRPAMDQAAGAAQSGKPAGTEIQLGAWRSEEEANAGWTAAKLKAGGVLDGFSPHIVTVDLPGIGRFYRVRVSVAAGQNQSAVCANLTAKGVACLPARD